MTAAHRYFIPMMAVVRRDLLLAWSYRTQFVTGVFSGFMSLAVFYYVSRLVRIEEFSPDEYFAFVAIGIMIFSVITATVNLPQAALRQELVAGTFERMLLAPRGAIPAIVSLLVYPALYAMVTFVALIFLGAAVFGLELQWSTVPLSIPVAILSLVAFAPLGTLLLASIMLMKKAPPGAGFLVVALSLVAGLYFPAALLPDWIGWASDVQPLTPAVDLLRSTLVGEPLSDPAWVLVAKLVGFAVVALPLSLAALRSTLRISRRRGTVLEF
jgi:ABC-2 type transport system permease protein